MSFLLNLFKKKTKNVNLTICGLDSAGKTAFVNYLIHGEFRETAPTMGISRKSLSFPKLDIHVFDMGGQEDFRPMWSDINEKSNALIYVVDSTDHLRFEETKEIFHQILTTQIDSEIPVLILLHKVDLPDRMGRIEFTRNFGLLDAEMAYTWAVFETSAVTGQGIVESMTWFMNLLGE
ncbi:MAG: GTP-binding protein [Asgard group archaeon]|nr:GTP-binding protein [Asgard group archaeon]